MNKSQLIFSVIPLVVLFTFNSGSSMADEKGYQLPPQDVVDIIDAAPEPSVSFSPDAKWMLYIERDAMPDIADVSRRMLKLAGSRIDPVANSRFATSYYRGLRIGTRSIENAQASFDRAVVIPVGDNAKISQVIWSHDSSWIAFSKVVESGQQLWVVPVDDPTKLKMLTDRLSTTMGGFSWMPDAKHLYCQLVPEDRGDEPVDDSTPTGPNIQESSNNKSPTRTYQDLLSNAYDEKLFEHFATNQLTVLGVDGSVKKVGTPAIFSSVDISPNGESFLVTTIQKPFSYLMTYRSFPRKIQCWDLRGNVQHTIADLPMDENIPIEGVRLGPRNVDWMSGRPASLVWAEALDGGDPNQEAEFRDQLFQLDTPFDSEPAKLMKIQHRSYGVSYMEDPTIIMTMEYDRDRRWIRSLMHDLKKPGESPKVLVDRSIRDRYGDPGRISTVPDETGHSIARQDGNFVYRVGTGASPKGNLPFIDRQDITTLKTERLWRCEEGVYEGVTKIVESSKDKKPVIITNSESKTSPPNYFQRNLNDDSIAALTAFKDPTPQIRGIKKELVKYKRSDGVDLSATLYLPADYKEGTRLPLIVWAYPREFNDAKTAGQISGSPSQFTRMRSITHLTLLTQGYAIMDAATMPVIGDPETMNDTFIEQIVGAAKAAIDKAAEMGVADPNRVGVGGHSYGAFMTANLMAHCDLFNAGIARSGAYNRTLTPFGFQSERRPFWEAKDVYFNISPFMHADKINEPLLLIHGEDDNNSGTFPVQSKRMYQAVKGNGGTVRLVMLPFESHGYRARQSVLHTQAEMIAWFDKYVKNASSNSNSSEVESEAAAGSE